MGLMGFPPNEMAESVCRQRSWDYDTSLTTVGRTDSPFRGSIDQGRKHADSAHVRHMASAYQATRYYVHTVSVNREEVFGVNPGTPELMSAF
jgi:hypothetical protein